MTNIDLIKDVAIPLISGIGGAVIGAVVGAVASYWVSSRLAKSAAKEVLARDKAARLDHDKRAAHQVFVKLHAIANSLGSYQKQILEMVARADSDGNGHMPLYQRLSSFVGIEREPTIEFVADELVIYITAKHALIGLTRSVARDEGPLVRANAVCPGWVRTPMGDGEMDRLAELYGLDNRDAAYKLATSDTPLKRPSEVIEVANVVWFLASPEASAMTGAIVPVDCGATSTDVPTLAFSRLKRRIQNG